MIIEIKKLKVCAIFGLYSHERCSDRDLYISLKITLKGEKASETDKIEDTVDYDKICELVSNETKQTKYYTLEKLASHLADKVKKSDKRITHVKIKIDKPGAVKNTKNISVIYEK